MSDVTELCGVPITNPGKVLFRARGITKLDLAHYYVDVAAGALRGSGGRPNVLVRYPNGVGEEFFYQKRAPAKRPEWLQVASINFPSGRTAEEVVPRDARSLVWMANLACLELHPHAVRAENLDHPDELRVDLDPMPGVPWSQLQDVAAVVRETLAEHGLAGWPKTSGSRGMHINVRIEPRWTFTEVPALATSKWWKEERHGVFVDYNQNAKDRTTAGAYSVRPTEDARVSAPLSWDEVADCNPADFTIVTVPARFAAIGDRHEGIDANVGRLDALLELSARQEREGHGDAPWPPQYRKQAGEPARVQPSRARKTGPARSEATSTPKARRVSMHPLIEIARARKKQDALDGLERWKQRHPDVVAHLAPEDVLVDAMRGRHSTWTRIRINLRHVPEQLRPAQEPLDPDEKMSWS